MRPIGPRKRKEPTQYTVDTFAKLRTLGLRLPVLISAAVTGNATRRGSPEIVINS